MHRGCSGRNGTILSLSACLPPYLSVSDGVTGRTKGLLEEFESKNRSTGRVKQELDHRRPGNT